jgi:hypothetical protein
MKRLTTCLLLLGLAACQRETPAPQASQAPTSPPAEQAQAAPSAQGALEDVIERDPRYIVGISYPPGMDKYPGLAAELQRYARAARGELNQAVDGLAGEKPSAPYDL